MAHADSPLPVRKIEGQNRVVLPVEVLKYLGLKQGDMVGFEIAAGKVVLHKMVLQKAR